MKKIDTLLMDRDGTLIADKHYLHDPAGVLLIPGAAKALLALGPEVRLFVVTNQSGIGRGMFGEKDLFACNTRLDELLAGHGVRISGYAFCPHAPEENCGCRKPALGMWRELSEKYGLEAKSCAMIGDKTDDILFAANAGIPVSALVLTGHGEKARQKLGLPDIAAIPHGADVPAGATAAGSRAGRGYILYPTPDSEKHPHVLAVDLAAAISGIRELAGFAGD